jgi:hypothetical protein
MNQKRILIVVSLLFSLTTISSGQQYKKSKGGNGEPEPTVATLARQNALVPAQQAQAPAGHASLRRTSNTTGGTEPLGEQTSVVELLAAHQSVSEQETLFLESGDDDYDSTSPRSSDGAAPMTAAELIQSVMVKAAKEKSKGEAGLKARIVAQAVKIFAKGKKK